MEAKDTVMTGKQIDAEMDRIAKLDTSYTTTEFELCKTQAEISFKAGAKEMFKKIRQALQGEPVVFGYAPDPTEIQWLYDRGLFKIS